MIDYIITLFFAASFLFSLFNGNMSKLSGAVLQASGSAVQMALTLAGAMALWGGVMQVAQKSGLTNKITILFKKPISMLFPSIPCKSQAFSTICLNITANLLGLGNAATPLGIKAMKQLSCCENKERNMAMLVVLNTSSIQLIPLTVAAIRMSHGSQSPWDCTVPILVVSFISVIAGCIMVSLLYMRSLHTMHRRFK